MRSRGATVAHLLALPERRLPGKGAVAALARLHGQCIEEALQQGGGMRRKRRKQQSLEETHESRAPRQRLDSFAAHLNLLQRGPRGGQAPSRGGGGRVDAAQPDADGVTKAEVDRLGGGGRGDARGARLPE